MEKWIGMDGESGIFVLKCDRQILSRAAAMFPLGCIHVSTTDRWNL